MIAKDKIHLEVLIQSEFNSDISQWNTSNVTNMSYLFNQSKFDGDISDWKNYNIK